MCEKKRLDKGRYKLLIIGASAIAVILRLPVLFNPHLSMEGIFAIGLKDFTFAETVESSLSCGHAPLYFLMISLWARISDSQLWIMVLPVGLNIVATLIIASIARKVAGDIAGVLGGIISAVAPVMIQHSASPRYEGLALLFGVLSAWYAYNIINHSNSKAILPYVLFTLLGVYSFYYHFFMIIAQNFYFIFRRRAVLYWIPSQFLVLLAVLPWVPNMAKQKTEWLDAGSSTPWETIVSIITNHYYLNIADVLVTHMTGIWTNIHGDNIFDKFSLTASILAPLLIAIAVFLKRYIAVKEWNFVLYATILQIVACSSALFVNQFQGLSFVPKYAVALSGIWLIMLAVGVSALKKSAAITALTMIFVCFIINAGAYYSQIMQPHGFKKALDIVAQNEMVGDIIVVSPAYYMTVTWYYHKADAKVYGCPEDYSREYCGNSFGFSEEAYRERVRGLSNNDRIWVITPKQISHPEQGVDAMLDEFENLGFTATKQFDFMGDLFPRTYGTTILFEKKSN
ncbi:MAG TPA: glycosyltransferase family 39 protein [bacterium]|nr:glycosyltransferase family 39 protein [bacterium]